MSGSAVDIDHLDAVYVVPADHPSPEAVRRQLDRVAATRLDAALERALADAVDPDDGSVCVIDRLDVELALDVEADDDALAATWAHAIAAAVRAAVGEPVDGDRVRRFTSRAEHLAGYIADTADGRARDRWHYDAFEGLHALPPPAAIREALERDPDDARPALAVLVRQRRLERVLAALGARGAERVAATLARGGSPTTGAVDAVLAVWNDIDAAGGVRPPDVADVLRLVAAAQPVSEDSASVAAAAHAIVALAIAHSAGETARAAILAAELSGGDLRVAERVAETVAPLAPRPASGTFVATAYAGVFLLVQGLLELEADRVLEALAAPDARDGPGLAALRLEVLARCLGDAAAAADPGVRLAAGATSEAGAVEDEDGLPAQRLLLERLVRLGRVDGRRLLLEPVEVEGRRFVLLRDATRGAWLASLAAGDEDEHAGERAVRMATEIFEREPESVQRAQAAHDEVAALGGAPDTVGLIARAVLRELAVRLPGLERSGAPYLRANFLAGRGTVRVDGPLLEVQLPASPLRVVLQLAGVHGRRLAVPWLGEVVLRLPEA